MPHVLNGVCTIYTEIPCLEMSGSNNMAVLNQVCFQTLFVSMRFQTGYYFRNGMVYNKSLKKVGRTVSGSGDTLI